MTAHVMSPEAQRLDRLAATQIIADPEVAHCWELIRHGIQISKIGIGNLDRLLGYLRARGGWTIDELSIECDPVGCLAGDPAAYHAHVERVRAAAQKWRDAIADPSSDPAARSTAEAELRALLSATGEQAAAGAPARAADLQRTVQALGIDPGRIAGALRTIAEWLEQRTPAAGAAVDRMIAALDTAAAPFLGRLTPATAEAERDQRIRESARAAIAAHLKLPRDPS